MVAFDLFGVVFTEGHMVSGTLMPLLPEDADRSIVKGFYNQYTLGKVTETAFWQGIGEPNNPSLRKCFLNTFVLDEHFSHVVDTLSDNYSLSILSNLGSDWAEVLINKFLFNQTFSPIIISGEVGCGKPDDRIYDILIEQSELPAEEIIFVDDRLENLATAHALGMKTIHYQREADGFDYQPDYCIKQLSDVLSVLTDQHDSISKAQ